MIFKFTYVLLKGYTVALIEATRGRAVWRHLSARPRIDARFRALEKDGGEIAKAQQESASSAYIPKMGSPWRHTSAAIRLVASALENGNKKRGRNSACAASSAIRNRGLSAKETGPPTAHLRSKRCAADIRSPWLPLKGEIKSADSNTNLPNAYI
ncbi:hypothetical protein TTRE_0000146301 [Trichuris trichiura]|uniref:Uncharacterized protein n=1 Tax=Trichuris trichiura TaxID=36087 RepID=A0A077Z3B2_TRITR|nr:hypothetical protein TTRE_0000146301 [Trichuris trichiura]